MKLKDFFIDNVNEVATKAYSMQFLYILALFEGLDFLAPYLLETLHVNEAISHAIRFFLIILVGVGRNVRQVALAKATIG